MQDTRFLHARALIEKTGILMQDRGQDGPAYQNVGQTIGVAGAETLRIALSPLLIVVLVRRLTPARHESGSEESNGVHRSTESELELQLRGQRHRVTIIDHIEVGDEA